MESFDQGPGLNIIYRYIIKHPGLISIKFIPMPKVIHVWLHFVEQWFLIFFDRLPFLDFLKSEIIRLPQIKGCFSLLLDFLKKYCFFNELSILENSNFTN